LKFGESIQDVEILSGTFKRKGVHPLKKFGISSHPNSPIISEREGFVLLCVLILIPLSKASSMMPPSQVL
jgi:hypothetical protein